LVLSAAAFRENPRSPRTWRALADKGVKGRRLALLAVFTIADIRATNPEAWTPWKERLLFELVDQLERPEANVLIQFAQLLKKTCVENWESYLESLDPFLIGSVPAASLAGDLDSLAALKRRGKEGSAPPKVLRVRGGKQTWVRFHSREDMPGLFLQFVNALAMCGLSVRHASIHTDPALGVYDWFEVKSSKTPSQIMKVLGLALAQSRPLSVIGKKGVRFDEIEVVAADEREWVVSFRGRDQSGALVTAARALYESGAQIHWAKVHTWGRQIDDVFGVGPVSMGVEKLTEELSWRLREV
jgi:[protein-PII] uridylyltransferase